MEQLLALIAASLVVMGSPGPTTMSVTAVGAAFGFRRSLAYMSGLILGSMAVLVAVAAGLVALLLSLPQLAPVLLAASAGYMLYLAWKIATAPPLGRQDAGASAPPLAGGFLLGVANPKAYFAIGAVFAGSRLAVEPGLNEALLKCAVLTVMIVLIHLGWLSVGVSISRLLRHPLASRLVNLLFAAILLATAIIAVARASFGT
jgi:threonine/homoserine/homoserine lactone efflux protein